MKNRTIALLFALLMLVSAGISAVVTLVREDMQNEAGTEKDRLIGVYVTTEYVSLVDMEKYIEDNIASIMSGSNILSPEDTAAYTEKLYAVEKIEEAISPLTGETYTTHDLTFPGLDGFGSYCYKTQKNGTPVSISGGLGAISERHTSIKSTDYGEEFGLTGTIYTSDDFNSVLYFNPLYQSADGSIYLVPGTGIHHSGVGLASHTMSEEETTEKDGETVTVYRSDITVNIEGVVPPDRITLLQFSADNELLSETEYTADTMPQTISLLPDTEYIITEGYAAGEDGAIFRELYAADDEYIEIFRPWKDGICTKESVKLEWN
ncbi:MAG: hypothetical protein IJ325_11510 [Clostridia bacterium]|nr:hypothetical protein [Clostridia bacterium]